jgi:hypothetical protein
MQTSIPLICSTNETCGIRTLFDAIFQYELIPPAEQVALICRYGFAVHLPAVVPLVEQGDLGFVFLLTTAAWSLRTCVQL